MLVSAKATPEIIKPSDTTDADVSSVNLFIPILLFRIAGVLLEILTQNRVHLAVGVTTGSAPLAQSPIVRGFARLSDPV